MTTTTINIPITIITEGTQNVNTVISTKNGTLNKIEKWENKKIQSFKIVEKLKKIGEIGRAERMKNCGDIIEYKYCPDCNAFYIKKANLCRDRFCPVCAWRLSLQRYNDMRRLMTNITQAYPEVTAWSLITLTVKNCYIDDLHNTMQKMSKAWNLTTAQRQIRPSLFGWAKAVEVTFNDDTKQVHPHYHILIGWWREESELLIKKWLKSCQKNGLIVDIKGQNAQKIDYFKQNNEKLVVDSELSKDFTKAVLETFKYSIKGSDIEKLNVSEFRGLVQQYSNKRLVAYGGKLKDYAKLLKIDLENINDDEIKIDTCKNCGGINLEEIVYKWSFGTNSYDIIK